MFDMSQNNIFFNPYCVSVLTSKEQGKFCFNLQEILSNVNVILLPTHISHR